MKNYYFLKLWTAHINVLNLVQFTSEFVHSLAEPPLVFWRDGVLQPLGALPEDHLALNGKVYFDNVLKPCIKKMTGKYVFLGRILIAHDNHVILTCWRVS